MVDATLPQAFIFEPSDDGLALVGVEFFVDAATWREGQHGAFVDWATRPKRAAH